MLIGTVYRKDISNKTVQRAGSLDGHRRDQAQQRGGQINYPRTCLFKVIAVAFVWSCTMCLRLSLLTVWELLDPRRSSTVSKIRHRFSN